MSGRPRYIQILVLLVAVGLLIAAGLLQGTIREQTRQADLPGATSAKVFQKNPQLAVSITVLGGLRTIAVNILWIRSQLAHHEGRHYDAYQLAEVICQLQPYFPGVWAFQAWNMGWNISVTTHTREERWRWVYNGLKLLRDQGIPLNPRSLNLYKELSWFYYSKIAGQLDDMHVSYKQRWGGMMQRLLGAPPYEGELSTSMKQEIEIVIDAFRPIAEAPLNKDISRRGKDRFQPDQLKVLLKDPAVKTYADQLAPFGVGINDTLLEAYNRWSLDQAVETIRIVPPKPRTESEKELSKMINSTRHAPARGKMLSFVRAQILWNEYKMDPSYMLELMEQGVEIDGKVYQIPLDWRGALPHAIYWAGYGLKVCKPEDYSQIEALNNTRNILNSLKLLTATGLINLQIRPDEPDYPLYYESADLRYITPTHEQHMKYIAQLAEITGKSFKDNSLNTGHVNYIIKAINLLAADGRIAEAQRYFDFIKEKYERTGPEWDFVSVEDFVVDNMQRETYIQYPVVNQLLQFTLKRAYVARGLRGDDNLFRNRFQYAIKIYNAYQKQSTGLTQLPQKFEIVAANMLTHLLARPRVFGLSLSVDDRSDIYLSMQDQPRILVRVYHQLQRLLRALCNAEGLDFAKAFPAPPGLKDYEEELQQKMNRQSPEKKYPR